ncbi:MAG: 5'-3' exonuclease H3TH domain-containing protein [Kineosporiaceae bacterium]
MLTHVATLLAVDTPTLVFRAFFGIPSTIRSPDGRPVNAVRGTLDMVATLLARFRPDALALCWDADWRPAFRVAALASYKAHRVGPSGGEEVAPELAAQFPVLADGLRLLGLPQVEAPGHEADDVLATLATSWSGHGPVVVVSGDRDLFQLVDDAGRVAVAYTGRGVAKLEVVDGEALQRRFGVPSGAAYRDFAVLVGDASDGLPGVPGVGKGTAADLLRRFGSLEGLLAAVDDEDSELSPVWRRKLTEARGYVEAAVTVVTGVRDAPLTVDPASPGDDRPGLELTGEVPDPDALSAWADRWGVRSSVNRVLAAVATGG